MSNSSNCNVEVNGVLQASDTEPDFDNLSKECIMKYRDETGNTILNLAVQNNKLENKLEIVETLLKKICESEKIESKFKDNKSWVGLKHPKIQKKNNKVPIQSIKNRIAMFRTFNGGDPHSLRRGEIGKETLCIDNLIKFVNTPNKNEKTPIYYAVNEDNVKMVELLIKNKADVDYKDPEPPWLRPLHVAIQKGSLEMVKLLIEWGADPITNDFIYKFSKEHTPLQFAINSAFEKLRNREEEREENYLIDHELRQFISKQSSQNIDNNNIQIQFLIQFLIQFVEEEDLNILGIDIEIMKFLEQAEKDFKLFKAIEKKSIDDIIQSIIGGANVNVNYKKWGTPLHKAITTLFEEHLEIVVLLIEHEGNVNATDREGKTPIDYDIFNLIDKAQKQKEQNENLFNGIEKNEIHAINNSINNGANVNARNNNWDTPLHVAVKNDKRNIVKILIEKGANVDAKNSEGKTPTECTENNDIIRALNSPSGGGRRLTRKRRKNKSKKSRKIRSKRILCLKKSRKRKNTRKRKAK